MTQKTIRLGKYSVTTNEDLSFDELCDIVDEALMREMRNEKTGLLLNLFRYLDSEDHPLTPREFFEFLGSYEDVTDLALHCLGIDMRSLPKG